MNLSDKLLRSFSDIINTPKESTKRKQNTTVYGTVVKNENGVSVIIDGSTIATPASYLVDIEDGDRVDVLIQNHKAVITGNHTTPAITRMGNVYVQPTDEGLVVGQLDDSGEPTGAYLLVSPTQTVVYNSDKNAIARFGRTSQIGLDNAVHTQTTASGYRVLDANGKTMANISGNRIEAYGITDTTTRFIASATDSNSGRTVTGSIYVGAGIGLFGLFDEVSRKWLINSDSDGNVRLFGTPIRLTSQSTTPTTISENYTYTSAANLNQWAVVVAYVIVGLNFESLVFINGGMQTRFISYYNGTRVIQGAFSTEWEENRVGVRCSRGEGTDNQLVTLQSVWGVIRKPIPLLGLS